MTARRSMVRLPAREGEARVWTVSEIVKSLKSTLETEYARVLVQGEITDFKRSGVGHIYFCLKDSNAQLQVASQLGAAMTSLYEKQASSFKKARKDSTEAR